MASSIFIYHSFREHIVTRGIDWINNTIKMALLANTYSPEVAQHAYLVDVSAYEVSSGGGYTTGGVTMVFAAGATSDPGNDFLNSLDRADASWASLTKTFRYGVMYADNYVSGSYKRYQPLIAYVLFDSAPADIVMTGDDFLVSWPAGGFLQSTSYNSVQP